LRVLLGHNLYRQLGGEDTEFRALRELLATNGNQITEYIRNNEEILNYGHWAKATLAPRAVWAWDSYRHLRTLLHREKAQVAHFHNTFPLISPAAYYACREEGVPVVQTLQNYRLFCPAANFFRDGKVCEECVEHSLWRGVRYGCYRGSRPATSVVALMLALHRARHTWTRMVDRFIAPSQFARSKLIAVGLPAEKIAVKPNLVHPDPGVENGAGSGAVFVGRLSPEKGLRTLLGAWEVLGSRVPLRIVGHGPLREELEGQVARGGLSSVRFEGYQPREQTLAAVKSAAFLIAPSECYETFSLSTVEAFACGLPVIASRLGAMQEIVEDGRTGMLFHAGNSTDLAEKVNWAWSHPGQMEQMGREARAQYQAKYLGDRNYELLLGVYKRAMETSGPTRLSP